MDQVRPRGVLSLARVVNSGEVKHSGRARELRIRECIVKLVCESRVLGKFCRVYWM